MKQQLGMTAAAVILIFLLAGCGRFAIEGQVSLEATPTAVPAGIDDQADIQTLPESDGLPASPATQAPRLPSLGLGEILILTGVSIVASIVLGAYLMLTGRSELFDARPMQDDRSEPKTLLNLLQFKPTVRAVALSICAWVFMLGIIAVAIIGTLALPVGSTTSRNQVIALTVPTSILLENNGNYVGLPLGDLACSLSGGGDRQQLQCDMAFEGQALALDVVLTAGTFWECAATYGDQKVPCRASFSDEDLQTFIVLNSTLGLSAARLRQLAADQPAPGMTEARWFGLAWMTAGALALAAFVALWRHSRARTITPSRATTTLAAIYSVSISIMLFGLVYSVAILTLLLLGMID